MLKFAPVGFGSSIGAGRLLFEFLRNGQRLSREDLPTAAAAMLHSDCMSRRYGLFLICRPCYLLNCAQQAYAEIPDCPRRP